VQYVLIVIDTALQIGEANSLSVYVDGASTTGDTPSNEWILVWRTIQRMAGIGHASPGSPRQWSEKDFALRESQVTLVS
jgi:hypothetical protein